MIYLGSLLACIGAVWILIAFAHGNVFVIVPVLVVVAGCLLGGYAIKQSEIGSRE